MGKLYYCDYCDRSFVDDLMARKKHLRSTAHQRNRKLHYLSCRDLKTLVEEESVKEECYKFKSSGQCQFGENCYRSHLTKQQLSFYQKQIAEEKSFKLHQEILELKTVESWLQKKSVLPLEVPLTATNTLNVPYTALQRTLPISLQPLSVTGLKDAEVFEWG